MTSATLFSLNLINLSYALLPAGDRFSLESVSSAGNTDCESVCILPLCMGESLLEIEIFGMGILLFFSSEDLIAIWAEE